MLDQMVVWIALKGHWLQPQCIYRGRPQPRQPRPVGHQIRQVKAQDVVANQMRCPVAQRL